MEVEHDESRPHGDRTVTQDEAATAVALEGLTARTWRLSAAERGTALSDDGTDST